MSLPDGAIPLLAIVPGILILLAIIAGRIVLARIDAQRIASYISQEGGNILNTRWTPFVSHVKAKMAERLYRVRFLDRNCHEHLATFKSGGKKRIFVAHDEIVRRSKRWTPEEALAQGMKKPQSAADGFGSYLTLRMRYKPRAAQEAKKAS